ncbi:MAG: hypothetical protein QOG23_3557 [Blastocatellia bacterium]|jgi:hypothetical protein|nr:hypothetical protein [Blastocatellia bacterium]
MQEFFLVKAEKGLTWTAKRRYTGLRNQSEVHLVHRKLSLETIAMDTRKGRVLKVLTVVLAFSFAQVYVQAGLLNPAPGAPRPQRVITARLTTKNNQPITVNGNSLGTGGTILTGATIETPDLVGATIDLGDAGVVELQPNTKIQLDFDQNGNVRVKVIQGCAATRKRSNALPGEMEIYTDKASQKTDKNRMTLGACILPTGDLGPLGSVATVGATAGGISGGKVALIVGGIAGGGAALAFALTRGGNPSP